MSAMKRILLISLVLASAIEAEVKVQKVAWKGWPNCYRVSNGEVELIVTSDVGPRVMSYSFVGGKNVLKEFTDQLGKSGEKEYQLRGGHRLWVAPESLVATKFVADTPPAVEMTRPLCVYPKVAKYTGSGSTSIAANFTCVVDEHDFNQTPAPKYGP